MIFHNITISFCIALFFLLTSADGQSDIPKPVIDSDWWQIAGNPDMGDISTPEQQPVDFGIWQATDGTWQLWSCIRKTQAGPKTRLLYGWEGQDITDNNWKERGITMEGDPVLGEWGGGLQAPHVIKEGLKYLMFYGDWRRICLAESYDGKNFQRVLNGGGQPDLFTEHDFEPHDNNTARDPMVIKRGNTYYCYYTSHTTEYNPDGAAYCRSSINLSDWTESVMVSHSPPFPGNSPKYSDECPHVVYLPEVDLYYLFVTQIYGEHSQTTVYASPNPYYFGIDDDRYKVTTLPVAAPEIIHHNDQWYIASTMPSLQGIHVARLKWE